MAASWPIGTTASASSYHAGQPVNTQSCPQGCYYTYTPSNAIDKNTTTFWNDDSLGVFPDVLSLNFPTTLPVSLKGIQVQSDDDGYITAYDVYLSVSASPAPFQAASVSGLTSSLSSPVSWNIPNSYADNNGVISDITAVQIRVNSAQDGYSRINEVYPVYGAAAVASSSSSSSSSGTTSTSTSSSSATNSATSSTSTSASTSTSTSASTGSGSSLLTHPIAGGMVSGVAGLVAVIAVGMYLY